MRITAALIVKNEARHLAECLSRVMHTVDEIVVVDTGSTDGTVGIARQFTGSIHHFTWVDDFAAARNASLAHATGDYVLVVDADERLRQPELARQRLDAFIRRHGGAAGSVVIESTIPSPGGKQVVVQEPRRFFKRGAYCFEGAIHEQVIPVSGQGSAAATGLRFEHPGYDHPPDSPEHKGHRNKRLLTACLQAHPGHEYYLYQLGKAHFSLGEYAGAVQALERALSAIRFKGQDTPEGHDGAGIAQGVLTDLVVSLAYAYVNTNRPSHARTLLEDHKALGHPGTRMADFPHALGYVYLMLGDIGRAKAAYEESLRHGPGAEQVRGTGSYGSEYHLGLLCEAERGLAHAVGHYIQALRKNPGYEQALARCIDLIVEQGLAPPREVWDVCDRPAFTRRYVQRYQALLVEGRTVQAALLMEAAELVAPELAEACRAAENAQP